MNYAQAACSPQEVGQAPSSAPAPRVFDLEQIAEVCHEANRGLQRLAGDEVSPSWREAPEWQKQSAIQGVQYALSPKPTLGDHGQHEAWMEEKLRAGWRWGPKKDSEAKTHPCLLPFRALPPEQQAKDAVFASIAHSMNRFYR